jgi:hypothetical protein
MCNACLSNGAFATACIARTEKAAQLPRHAWPDNLKTIGQQI